MPNVILVNPMGVRVVGDRTMPMGLLAISSFASKDFNIQIIDQRFEKNWKELLLNGIKSNPLCVGVTTLTGKQILSAIEVAKIVKKHSSIPVVWGGVHPTLMSEETIKDPLVDILIEGEGDISFYELLKKLSSNTPIGDISGIWYKDDGKIKKGPPPLPVDITKLPPIPYELIDINNYIEKGTYGRTLSVFTSRGCPNRCTFCYNTRFFDCSWKGFPVERCLGEITNFIKNYNIEHIQFMDDNFFADIKRGKEIVTKMKEMNSGITWSVFGIHVKTVLQMDLNFLKFLEEYGCKIFNIGSESGSEKILKLLNKGFTKEDLLECNRRLYKTNIRPSYSFIVGFPSETDSELKDTVDIVFRLKEENPNTIYGSIKPFVCYPGTALYSLCLKKGFNPPDALKKWGSYSWHNYLNIDIPWADKKRRQWLSDLYFTSIVMNPDHLFVRSKLFEFIVKLIKSKMERRVKTLKLGTFPLIARMLSFIQNHIL